MTGGTTLTLQPGDHVVCSIYVDATSTLRTATGAGQPPVRIHVDASRCTAPPSGVAAGDVLVAGRLNPGVTLSPTRLQLTVAGEDAHVRFGSSGVLVSSAFFLYAPGADVQVDYSAFTGTIVGRDVRMTARTLGGPLGAAGVITQDLELSAYPTSPQGRFRVVEHRICAGGRGLPAERALEDC